MARNGLSGTIDKGFDAFRFVVVLFAWLVTLAAQLGPDGLVPRIGPSLAITTITLTVLATGALTWWLASRAWRSDHPRGHWGGLALRAFTATLVCGLLDLYVGIAATGAGRGFGWGPVCAVALAVASIQLAATALGSAIASRLSSVNGPSHGSAAQSTPANRPTPAPVPEGELPWRADLDRAWDAAAVRTRARRAARAPAVLATGGLATLVMAWVAAWAEPLSTVPVAPGASARALVVATGLLLFAAVVVGGRAVGEAVLLTEHPARPAVANRVGWRLTRLTLISTDATTPDPLVPAESQPGSSVDLLVLLYGRLPTDPDGHVRVGVARGERFAVLVGEHGDATLARLPRSRRQTERWARRAENAGLTATLSSSA